MLTKRGSRVSGLVSTPGVIGRSWDTEDTLAERVGRGGGGAGASAGVSGRPDVGASSLTIADSMAGRTLKFLSCLLRSDLAALGALLIGSQVY